MKNLTLTLFLILSLIGFSLAQKPTPIPSANDENDVVKVSTSLVQLDAVVTDKKGNPVNSLTAEDFEILQDGKAQKITNFSYINRVVNSNTSEQTLPVSKQDKKSAIPPISFRPKELGRVITFVVDDGNCETTTAGIEAIRNGLKKFISEQMLPDDSVAIYRTRAGSSLLQQYTNDKSILLKIVEKIRWYPPLGICNSITGENYEAARNEATLKPGGTFESDRDKEFKAKVSSFNSDNQAIGAVGVMNYVIKGLYPVGGRKILFLMSDSLPLVINTGANKQSISQASDAIKRLTVLANRASVVINTIDVRGLDVPMMSAQDNPGGIKDTNPLAADAILAERAKSDDSRQSGLSYVANETGGNFYQNMSNLAVPIQKTLASEQGYYLLAYEPNEETFKGKEFHKISLKLKRNDLVVSSRSGFYGVTDNEMRPKSKTTDSELYEILTAPFAKADLNFRLSAYFDNSAAKGNFIHSVIHIEGKDITMVDEPSGTKKVVFDIVAVTMNEKNEIIDDSNRTATVHIPSDQVEQVRRNGLVYSIDVPVKKEGVYTFRTALRETSTKRVGASNQLIEVPDLKKQKKMLISGLKISGVDSTGKMLPSEGGDNGFSTVISPTISAIRKLRRNSIVAYTYNLYNAKVDATNPLKLTVQTNLYYDGKLLSEGQPQSIEVGKDSDLSRVNDFGYLRLNAQVPTGDYVLQVIVKDLQTNQTASQWIDFEIVE